ncbi:MAG: uncharacterized protein KVP18_002552 [Porospora cf. gigantea A]|uniref:uncharacterized protein n=1 Tax=Porospora cf. gigantea A TaxID=2853593 RepID=UPI0035596D22|nr:MAG: hypothetical protein KVP18_002552 [Porospora cf. gigantea A]
MLATLLTTLAWSQATYTLRWDMECLTTAGSHGTLSDVLTVLEMTLLDDATPELIDSLFSDLTYASALFRDRLAEERREVPSRVQATGVTVRDEVLGYVLGGIALMSSVRWSASIHYLPGLGLDLIDDDPLMPLLYSLITMNACVKGVEEEVERRIWGHTDRGNTETMHWAGAGAHNDPWTRYQWYLGSVDDFSGNAGMSWTSAWTWTEGSKVLVAVVDTGCNDTGDVRYATNLGWNFIADTPDVSVNVGEAVIANHGTEMSTLIAAVSDNAKGLTGTCQTCEVVCLKVADAQGRLTSTTILKGLEYLYQHSDQIRISNHAYGGTKTSFAEQDAIRLLNDVGHIVVAPAGNDGCNFGTRFNCKGKFGVYPALYPQDNIISVGSSDPKARRAFHSNYGYGVVDTFAPGVYIPVSIQGALTFRSGTSYSAALVSAAVAQSMSLFPLHQPSQLKALVREASPYGLLTVKDGNGGVLDMGRLAALSAPDNEAYRVPWKYFWFLTMVATATL